jgi:transcriptional regulator GlxA family with amidase domain
MVAAEMKDALASLARQRPLEVGILLFDDVEVLDFAGPFEVFSVAARLAARAGGQAPFQVRTFARGPTVRARHGLEVRPSASLANMPADILVVPGGVVDAAMQDRVLLDWIAAAAGAAKLTASVCTGAFLLARASVVAGTVTTHWEDIPDLRAAFPHLTVVENVPFVDQGNIITSAGISAGIEMSLYLVGEILGSEAASRTARQMQYSYKS